MKTAKYVTSVALLAGLCMLAVPSSGAAPGRGGKSHAGGNAGAHMSSRGSENTNAQWSADPERGWVRADERHEMEAERKAAQKNSPPPGKHKGRERKKVNR